MWNLSILRPYLETLYFRLLSYPFVLFSVFITVIIDKQKEIDQKAKQQRGSLAQQHQLCQPRRIDQRFDIVASKAACISALTRNLTVDQQPNCLECSKKRNRGK